jgi:RNA polymerase sigma-70 factor (ECF subfamily)
VSPEGWQQLSGIKEKVVYTTSLTLLERLRDRQDVRAWQVLVELYAPLLRRWLRAPGLQAADIEDLTQEVLTVLAQKMPHFVHNQHKVAFRRWLKAIAVHKVGDFLRAHAHRPLCATRECDNWLEELADSSSGLSQEWDRQHDQYIVRGLLDLLKPDFAPTTWEAFRLRVLEDQPTAAVAQRLGLSVNAVVIAKTRVLARLRQELPLFTDLH